MRSMRLLAATAALTVSSVAVAGPNYTYAQLGYLAIDSVGNEDSGGFELKGSFGFADVLHVGASIAAVELEGGKSKDGADVDAYDIYFGYIYIFPWSAVSRHILWFKTYSIWWSECRERALQPLDMMKNISRENDDFRPEIIFSKCVQVMSWDDQNTFLMPPRHVRPHI